MENKQYGIAPIVIVLIVLGVLVVGGGAYYFINQQQYQRQTNSCPTAPKTCADGSVINFAEPNCNQVCPEDKQVNEIGDNKSFLLIQFSLMKGANSEIIKEIIKNTDGELLTEKQITDFGWDYYYVKFKTAKTIDEKGTILNELKEKSKNTSDIFYIQLIPSTDGIYKKIFEKELEILYGKSLTPIEVLLKFSEALKEGDIEEAVSYFREDIREDYKEDFYQVKKDGVLQELAGVLKEFKENYIKDDTAEFEVIVNEEGEDISFYIYLMKNTKGQWEIYSL
ncbi:MAG: hypothetical protein ABIC36_01515 [bacterium]